MKIRLTNDAVRLRLSDEEVTSLCESGSVATAVDFGTAGRSEWILRPSDADAIDVALVASRLEISIPRRWIEGWGSSERIAFKAAVPVGRGRSVSILIEKDLPCRHGSE
jgi:hypothetical protein